MANDLMYLFQQVEWRFYESGSSTYFCADCVYCIPGTKVLQKSSE